MAWEPLAVGLVATVLAVAQILGWLALGSCFIKNQCDDIISIPSSLLIGSGLTAFVYAIFAATGHVQAGIAFGIVVVVVAVALFRQRLFQMSRSLSTAYTELGTDRRWFLALWTATLVLYWAIAITPPRDADVMRYHLAHIQQINMENAWLPVPDWHYALPFGWTLNYLAFEHFGIPQVANLINLGLWIIFSVTPSDPETTVNHTHCASYLHSRRLSSIYAEDGNHCLCRYVHHFRNVIDNDVDCSSSKAQFDAVWLTWICSMDWHTESLPGYCDRTLSHTLNVLLSLSP